MMSADAVLHWSEVAFDAAFAPGPASPVPFFRNLAIVHVAMYDAVNAIDRSHDPYFANVHASSGASMEAAAAQAAHNTLSALYPSQQTTFDAALAEDLVGIPPGRANQGIEVGKEVARQILEWRSTDGSDMPGTFSLPDEPGNWQPTGAPAAFVHAGSITPFAVESTSQFRPDPPPSLASAEYAAGFNEAKELGGATSTARTTAQTNAAMAWRTPFSLQKAWFVDIAAEVAQARGNSLPENARLFAMLGVANNDTLQTTFASKYHYGLWRPVTAIQRADEDGNPDTVADPSWTPLHPATPPYPTYAGNAAGVGATFATVLSNYFGSDDIGFDIQWPDTVGGPRSYASFSQAAQETADSRIWGGIHFRFDSLAGEYVGTHVADHVLDNFFQPRKHGMPWFAGGGQALGSNSRALELGDLDGDGDLDVFVGCGNWQGGPSCTESQVWLNDGSGQFTQGWSGGTPSVAHVALGDLDNDGDLDAFLGKVSVSNSTPQLRPSEIWLNDGQGTFADTGQRLDDAAFAVALGDVDGDGDLDAVTGSVTGSVIVANSKIWLNDGTGHFADSGQHPAAGCWSFAVTLGDVDGDQDLDALFGCGSSGGNHGGRLADVLYLNDGTGEFTDSGQEFRSVSTYGAQLGDLDLDGDLDAILVHGDQRGGNLADEVWVNNGNGTFTDSGQRLGRLTGRSVRLGDLDDDGDLDAVVGNGITLGSVTGQANVVWLNDGSGVFTSWQELGNAATSAVALGDLDNDGDLDAVFGNIDQGNQLWFNTPLAAGDANRDGQFDSADLVQVFQAGKYEDDVEDNSTWEEGDWNGDGDFDSGDLVTAFQEGLYERQSSAASNAVVAVVDWLFAKEGSIRRKRAFVA
jgi:hypothetical protein